MKRTILFLAVIMVAVMVGGTAFAVDSMGPTQVSTATVADVAFSTAGGTVISVAGFGPDQTAKLNEFLDEQDFTPLYIIWGEAIVGLDANNNTVTYSWPSDMDLFLYNKSSLSFVVANWAPRGESEDFATKGAINDARFDIVKGGNYDLSNVANQVKFDFVKAANSGTSRRGGSSGGCSVITLGALFALLAPMGVMAFKKK